MVNSEGLKRLRKTPWGGQRVGGGGRAGLNCGNEGEGSWGRDFP